MVYSYQRSHWSTEDSRSKENMNGSRVIEDRVYYYGSKVYEVFPNVRNIASA